MAGTAFDTLVWTAETQPTLSWQTTVGNLQAGERSTSPCWACPPAG
jgi:hypothetical protein